MTPDREEQRDAAEPQGPPTWADDVQQLVRQELGNLGINVPHRPQTLVLSTAQRVWAIMLAVAAMLAFIATFAQGWAAAFTWMCQVGWITTWCALPG